MCSRSNKKKTAIKDKLLVILDQYNITPQLCPENPKARDKIIFPCSNCGASIEKIISNFIRQPNPGLCKSCKLKNVFSDETIMLKKKNTFLAKYGTEHPAKCEKIKQKTIKTNLKKYGVASPAQNPEIKEKMRKTNLEKYGAAAFTQTAKGKALLRKIFQEKYGVAWISNVDEIIEKIKNSSVKYSDIRRKHLLKNNPSKDSEILEKKRLNNIKKWGVPSPSMLPEIQEKIKQTRIDKYGIEGIGREKLLRDNGCKNYQQFCKRVIQFLEEREVAPSSKIATDRFKCSGDTLITALRHSGREDLINKCSSSVENDIANFIASLDSSLEIIRNDRTVLKPQELDIYLPQKKMAFEINGPIWHSEKYTQNKYKDYKKYKNCLARGIELFTIYDYEWLEKPEIMKNFLKSKIISLPRVFARKTEITTDQAKLIEFTERHHIQGSRAGEYWGLVYEGEIVMAIAINSHHRKRGQKVLSRVVLGEYHVIGGLEKLLAHQPYDKLITWSDNRLSPGGNLYKKSGFTLSEELRPDYFYVNSAGQIKSKQSMSKSRMGCPAHVKEADFARSLGYYRIWDCGKKRWEFIKS